MYPGHNNVSLSLNQKWKFKCSFDIQIENFFSNFVCWEELFCVLGDIFVAWENFFVPWVAWVDYNGMAYLYKTTLKTLHQWVVVKIEPYNQI